MYKRYNLPQCEVSQKALKQLMIHLYLKHGSGFTVIDNGDVTIVFNRLIHHSRKNA